MFGNMMNSSPSLADIAAVTDGNRNNGFGDGQGWWVLIILLALFGGWGNGGWGNNRGNSGSEGGTTIVTVPTSGFGGWGAYDAASMQRGFDTSGIITKLDGINNGICNLGYDQLSQMNGINTNIMQTGFGLQQAINNDTVASMQNTNALSTQISNCCCDMRAELKDISYQMATQDYATRAAIHEASDNIINSQNWGFRNLQDTINAGFQNLERQSDHRYIAELERKLNTAERDTALQSTASYIINTVRPPAVPAYPSCNPNGVGNWAPEVLNGGNFNSNRCAVC